MVVNRREYCRGRNGGLLAVSDRKRTRWMSAKKGGYRRAAFWRALGFPNLVRARRARWDKYRAGKAAELTESRVLAQSPVDIEIEQRNTRAYLESTRKM
jgi:hypothetical protein